MRIRNNKITRSHVLALSASIRGGCRITSAIDGRSLSSRNSITVRTLKHSIRVIGYLGNFFFRFFPSFKVLLQNIVQFHVRFKTNENTKANLLAPVSMTPRHADGHLPEVCNLLPLEPI